MLKERALRYYKTGCNCSQCILKAAEEEYGLTIPQECYECCEGIYNGFGIGSVCSVLIGCIMVIGLSGVDVSCRRLYMTERFNSKFCSVNCGCLIRDNECSNIIADACDILEDILTEDSKNIKINL